jgi:uncharacterized protein YeaO (DUF488 family)
MIQIKRIYDASDPSDGLRVLVDRLWPRGINREAAAIDLWAKTVAPSTQLRQWYNHEPERWPEFQLRYRMELSAATAVDQFEVLRAASKAGSVTLLTAARNENENHAVVLLRLLTERRSSRV